LPAALAQNLAERSDEVADTLAAGDDCGAAAQADDLRGAVVAAINDGRVPPPLQEELSGAANALVSRIECVEAPPPPPPPATTAEEEDDDGGETETRETEQDEPEEPPEEQDEPLETVIDTLTDEIPTLPTDTSGETTTETVPTETGG
jgi:hypothetical protein